MGSLALSSCVTSKVHKDLQAQYQACQDEVEALRNKNREMEENNTELQAKFDRSSQKVESLTADTTQLGNDLRMARRNYDELNKSYEFLLKNNNTLLANNARENKALLTQMEALQTKLQTKEDSLRIEQARLSEISTQLAAREQRVNELEGIIQRKDSVVEYVRSKVSDALLGFQGNGLTVEMKNGQVYVSMDNSLLFASGSWNVAPQGKVALEKLAAVLADNPDIRILVEGHTDDDAYRGRGQVSDNWDLSVMRATSVVKIITENSGIDPKRITAAGRGEFLPLADNGTAEGKATNRRTEIILTPDLTELADLIETIK
ncbi:MAG: OmpA family protein [Schleiferiaceae bacterium]